MPISAFLYRTMHFAVEPGFLGRMSVMMEVVHAGVKFPMLVWGVNKPAPPLHLPFPLVVCSMLFLL